MPSFDIDRFELLDDEDRGFQVLREKYSEQRTILTGRHRWQLQADPEDGAFVGNGTRSVWCDDIFDDVISQDAQTGDVYVLKKGGAVFTLAEYRARHTALDVPLVAAGHASLFQRELL